MVEALRVGAVPPDFMPGPPLPEGAAAGGQLADQVRQGLVVGVAADLGAQGGDVLVGTGITSYRGTGTSTFDDPAIASIAAARGKTPAQVMIRWHLQEGRSAIPKSVRPERIAENFDVFDFELTTAELNGLDALDTGVRGGPEPDESRSRPTSPIPEAEAR